MAIEITDAAIIIPRERATDLASAMALVVAHIEELDDSGQIPGSIRPLTEAMDRIATDVLNAINGDN